LFGSQALLFLLKYNEQLLNSDREHANQLLVIIIPALAVGYVLVRYLKKTGKFTE
jgi:hypothetical protein